MDFIKRFPFIQKFKDNNNKNSATSLGRQKSKRSIFSHHTNDRLVSCRMNNARDVDSDDDDQDDDDQDEYNSNTLIFRQKPLNAITITTTNTNKPKTNTSKSKSARPTHQFYMHHHKDSSSTVKSQLLSLSSSNDIQQHKQLSITFEGKDAKYPNKHEKPMVEENYHHKQEKLAMRHPEKKLYQDSTLYAPFIERPEIIEDDYIPLPTVTRKYIDPPPDVLLDSIPSFHHTHKKYHRDPLDNDSTTNTLALSPTATAVAPLQKPKNKLVVNTKRLDDTSIADIGAWLSKNSVLETNDIDIQQSVPKSTTF